jgi:PleD family two-component response regulator
MGTAASAFHNPVAAKLTGARPRAKQRREIPHGTALERFATMTVFVLTIGRCMFLAILARADGALYAAEARGRNRIASA